MSRNVSTYSSVTVGIGVALLSLAFLLRQLAAATRLPVFLLSSLPIGEAPFLLCTVLPAVLFWIWCPQLFRGEGSVPKRSVFGFTVLVLLSVFWYLTYSHAAAGHRGILIANLAFIVVLLGIFGVALLRRGFAWSATFHALVVAWLSSVAFPSF